MSLSKILHMVAKNVVLLLYIFQIRHQGEIKYKPFFKPIPFTINIDPIDLA